MALQLVPLPRLPGPAEPVTVALTPDERREIRELLIEYAGRLERETRPRKVRAARFRRIAEDLKD